MTKKQTREKRVGDILEAAVNAFIERGYENTSMDLIASRSGLTKGGLYHYFNSKDEILIEANEMFMVPIYKMMGKALNDKDPVNGISEFIEKYTSYWARNPNILVFIFLTFGKLLTEPSMWEYMDEYKDRMMGFYEAILRKGVEAGVFKKHNVRSRAISMMAALDGITAYAAMSSDLDPDRIAQHLIRTFIVDIKRMKK